MKRIYFILAFTLFSCLLSAQSSILIKNVNVWDGTSNQLKNNYSVLVEDNLIRSVERNIPEPNGALIINGVGKTLIPGLSDAHVHLQTTMSDKEIRNDADWMYLALRAGKVAESFLMMGFTTVRDMGGPIFGVKRAVDEGLIPGPRIYPSGAYLSQTSGHGDLRNRNDLNPYWSNPSMNPMDNQGWFYIVDGVPEVLKATRENLKNGASQIKIMAGGGISSEFDPIHSVQFTPNELEAAVQAALDWDTYVAAHIYNSKGIIRALKAGVKSIEHGHLLNDEAAQLLKEKDAWLVPQSFWTIVPKDYWTGDESIPDTTWKKIQEVLEGAVQEMELAKKYNLNLAFGTDAYGPLGFEKYALMEFTSRMRWYSPLEVLKQATSENARLFNLSGKINPYTEGKLGVIEKGAYADLLIYEGNPIEDVEVVVKYQENLKLIMKDGKIFKNELKE